MWWHDAINIVGSRSNHMNIQIICCLVSLQAFGDLVLQSKVMYLFAKLAYNEAQYGQAVNLCLEAQVTPSGWGWGGVEVLGGGSGGWRGRDVVSGEIVHVWKVPSRDNNNNNNNDNNNNNNNNNGRNGSFLRCWLPHRGKAQGFKLMTSHLRSFDTAKVPHAHSATKATPDVIGCRVCTTETRCFGSERYRWWPSVISTTTGSLCRTGASRQATTTND